MSIKELNQYAPEMYNLLEDDRKKDKNGQYISQVPNGLLKQMISELEAKVNISLIKRDVKAISKTLVKTASGPVTGLNYLSRLQRKLENFNALKKIISATKIPEITKESNKIQKKRSEQCKNERIDFSDHFSLELVKKRLNKYNISNISNKQILADVMIMLCIHPAEIKNLHIFNGNVTGYAKNRRAQDIPQVFRSLEKNEKRARQLLIWIQEAISSRQLKDPEKPGSVYLKAIFAIIAHDAKNLSETMTIANETLHHNSNNHTFPAKNYTIQNIRVYKALSGQIWMLEKRLEDYHFEYVKLKRKVNLLEAELDNLDECIDKKIVVNLIQEIVLSLIGKKDKRKKDVPYKQRRKWSTSSETSSSKSSSFKSSSSESSSLSESSFSETSLFESSTSKLSLSKSSSSNSNVDETVIDSSTNINCISQKHINELGITYHDKSNSIETSDAFYSTLGKVNLHIILNDGKKHKSISSKFIVVRSNWPDQFPKILLGSSWISNNKMIDDEMVADYNNFIKEYELRKNWYIESEDRRDEWIAWDDLFCEIKSY
ncbi:hypothetical protein C1645_812336 [Glomus cerebriforme]|uniref:Uncharacterized protein n=1 Tax=Glomus cerebriforme TaxID=658196 RepID=A0A397TPK3_9GLOM|nr:hypothetical protein C1645_812336 [Glomus cerebriforme]